MANIVKHKRGSGNDPSSSDLVLGELAIRTDNGKLFTKMDSGAIAEIAGGGSDIAINTLSSSSATGGGSATFNGSAYRFTLSSPPSVSAQQLLVSIAGVIQKPVAGNGQPSEGFSINGNDIILAQAPASGTDFFILTFRSLGVSEPADNTVTNAKVASNAAIAGSKISPTFNSTVQLNTAVPSIEFNSTTHDNDFRIINYQGNFIVQDTDATANRFEIASDGTVNFLNNVNANSGLDVTGNITGTANLTGVKSIQGLGYTAITGTPHTYYYGRGSQAGGVSVYSKESALEIVSSEDSTHGGSILLRTVTDGAGFVYNSTTNALELKLFTPSANDFTIHGTGSNLSSLDTQLRVVKDAQVELAHNGTIKLTTSSSGIDVTGDITATGNLEITSANPKIYLTDTDNNSDYIVQNNNGAFRVYDNTNSSQRFIIGADGKAYFTQELNAQGGVTVTGDIEPATNGNGNIGNNGTGSPKKFSQAFFDVGVSISDSTTGLRLGTSFDTRFYHNGSGTNLDHSGTGGFLFRSNNGIMLTGSTSGGKVMANFTPDGSADLYYAHSKKFETQNLGVTVTGGVYPAATNTYQLGGSSLRWNELNIKSVIDVSDNGKIRMGDSDDFEIYHESGFNQIKTTNSSPIQLRTASELMIKAIPDAEVQIYHDGNEKIRTKSNGCLITGTLDINGGTENGAGDASLYVHANSNNDWGVVVDALSDGKSNYGLKIVGESGTTHAFSIVQGSSHTQKFLIDADGDTVTSGNVTAANFIGNGSQLTNLPASATNSPAFSAYRSNNYSPSNGSEVVIDFDQERIDTDGCYNFNNGRFTPTTAGNYQINLNFFWSGTSSNKIKQAHGYIRKNGSENIGQFWHDANDSYKENRQGVSVSTIVAMNGSTDYIEAIGYCLVDSGSPRFNAQGATFSGFKLA